jgi:hypothetical protein
MRGTENVSGEPPLVGQGPAHVWSCGRCRQRLTARVGAILAIFTAHARVCPGRRAAPPPAADRRPARTSVKKGCAFDS